MSVVKFLGFFVTLWLHSRLDQGVLQIGELEFSHKFTNQFLISSPLIS